MRTLFKTAWEKTISGVPVLFFKSELAEAEKTALGFTASWRGGWTAGASACSVVEFGHEPADEEIEALY